MITESKDRDKEKIYYSKLKGSVEFMKMIITAPRGKMASLIVADAAARDDVEIVAGIGPAGRDYIGRDIGEVVFGDQPIEGVEVAEEIGVGFFMGDFDGVIVDLFPGDASVQHRIIYNLCRLRGSKGYKKRVIQ